MLDSVGNDAPIGKLTGYVVSTPLVSIISDDVTTNVFSSPRTIIKFTNLPLAGAVDKNLIPITFAKLYVVSVLNNS
jgi:hypothetical protein